jgi:hypothetical protein
MCSLVGGTIAENFVEIIRTDKVRPFLSIQRLLNILVYRKYPASRSIRIGLLGLVFIRHDEEATTRPWANILLINVTTKCISIHLKITEIICT